MTTRADTMFRRGKPIIVGTTLRTQVFIRFLYCWSPIPLENLSDKWHFISAQANPYDPDFDLDQRQGAQPRWRASATLVAIGAMDAGWSIKMLDIIMLAIGLGFFALSVGYTIACDQL